MGHPGFTDLVGDLVGAMGLNVAAVRPRDELIFLRTPDGFLFAFVDDTSRLSLEHLRQAFAEVGETPAKLVVLTPDRLPLALGAEVVRQGGTLVEGGRFTELAKGLGLGERLGEPPRATVDPRRTRLLPSARALDEVVERAETWEGWGVPALALRFYRQGLDMKPEFAPARLGIGRSLLALGLPLEADRTFEEVLRTQPENVDARVGRAAVLGATGHPDKEIAEYRALLHQNSGRPEVRAHLLAALLDARDWAEARDEVETMLRDLPDDPRLRFLHGVALEKLGKVEEAGDERSRARALGLPFDAEKALCEHLGLPPPPLAERSPSVDVPPPVPSTPMKVGAKARRPTAAGSRRPAKRTSKPKRPAVKRPRSH